MSGNSILVALGKSQFKLFSAVGGDLSLRGIDTNDACEELISNLKKFHIFKQTVQSIFEASTLESRHRIKAELPFYEDAVFLTLRQQCIRGGDVKNINDLFEAALIVAPIFAKKMEECGMGKIIIAPLKTKERAMEKSENDYTDKSPRK